MEKDALRPLPDARHHMRQRAVATVRRNSHVTLNKHHYSVPTQYVGKRVELVYDADTIDVFHGFSHVTTHHRASVLAERALKHEEKDGKEVTPDTQHPGKVVDVNPSLQFQPADDKKSMVAEPIEIYRPLVAPTRPSFRPFGT